MNVKELREYLDELEQGWDEDLMGSFDLVPVYSKIFTVHSQKNYLLRDSVFKFDYVSNSIVIDCW